MYVARCCRRIIGWRSRIRITLGRGTRRIWNRTGDKQHSGNVPAIFSLIDT